MELRRYLDPRTTWKDTTEVDKVRLYTRQSFISIIVALLVAAVTDTVSRGEWATAVAMAVSATTAVIAIRRMPRLGGTARGDIRWPVALCVAGSVTAGITSSAPALWIWALLITSIPISAMMTLRVAALTAVVVGAGTIATRFGVLGGVIACFVVLAMAASTHLSIWLLRIVSELDASRHAASALSVAEERLRFSRDLHDVVGRALSAIAVKSELAATLSRRGDDRAASQMDEVRDLAHQSMTEARQLARGYRQIDLVAEIDGARSLLNAAGIETDTVGNADTLDPAYTEAAAWVVREGATNVLRHSDATRCRIGLSQNGVTMTNDRPHAVRSSDGTGLAGLRERLAAVDGTLDVACTADEFTLFAAFPATVAS
ncbi:sensor histidine kinase [Rhodococcus sp. BP-252]|uniref:sensor histidine kinase n=1 Tax=unclassified Rhodococcus (in: high G+C Gram-positive bacteria) TaxID=192944 RepID=UPI001C9A4606|nr:MULTISPECIES: histidine kinase [unclassified Rhodococcus (in: high G+C Gram-positive bacteria)]MBY6412676.1 sensor histidine kinase [Rhodococcus sp. BP-320]MBY6417526.1 sensor histidine kinase [Rhodococcus sp. BP-321]MBY6421696.1 sensor histidine kinase [Rhodococcus sp. BP-324]MBY6427435.1 sensor histidine kinase [Rhodococcus sp. BP-323]MBY6432714.1 sensor histidine kinase [Rhodococcus sp. BP-322]